MIDDLNSNEFYTIDDFGYELSQKLGEALTRRGLSAVVDYTTIQKNNIEYKGLCVMFHDTNVGPFLYIDKDYYDILNGVPMYQIVESKVKLVEEAIHNAPDIQQITKDEIKNNLFVEMINREMNQKIEEQCAHQDINDLMLIPRLKCVEIDGHVGSCIVTSYCQAAILNMTDDELLSIAKENTFEKNDYICVGIDNMIAKLGGEKEDESADNCAYVLTNSTNIYGSTALADPTTLQMVKQTINEDEYFIIPSTIHECIIIPSSLVDDPADLKDMLNEINSDNSIVKKEDVLSNNVYRYNGKRISICNSLKDLQKQLNMEQQTNSIKEKMIRGIK